MEQALYGPDGYYATGAAKSGRQGDYFTAPDVSPVFGRLLAAVLAEWTSEFAVRPFHWIEAGAGEGALVESLGAALKKDHASTAARLVYSAVERSAPRREKLAALAPRMPCAFRCLPDLSSFASAPVTGCLFANELIDALPVHRVRAKDGRLEEGFVEQTPAGAAWRWAVPSTERLGAYFERLKITLPSGYETEVNLAMRPWLAEASAAIRSGLVVLIDYGRPAHEYYDPERRSGTLRGFRRHEVRRDVLAPGILDITADVDFTSLALDAQEAGFTPLGFMDLGAFLMQGVRSLAKEESRRALDHGAVLATYATQPPGTEWAGLRYLIHPEGMGSAFHALILGKGIAPEDWSFEGNRIRRLGLP
jgi:SAM-dependent MidA family methyltransferase